MKNSKIVIAYLLSVFFISLSVCGVFHQAFLIIDNHDFSFFMQCSSLFFGATLFLSAVYCSTLLIKNRTTKNMLAFGENTIDTAIDKLSRNQLSKITDSIISKLYGYEDCMFELLGFSVPFFVSSITIVSLIIYINPNAIWSVLIAAVITTVIIKLAVIISSICDIKSHKTHIEDFIKNFATSSKGIQFYNSKDYVLSRLDDVEKISKLSIKQKVTGTTWKAFCCILILFVGICLLYTLKADYTTANLLNISGIEILFLSFILFYTLFLISFLRYLKIKKVNLRELSHYKTDKLLGDKKLDNKELFVAFHGVYFQDPTYLTENTILTNISFSVLPGEFITITGPRETLENAHYIFDLILRFYKAQSGRIYLSGTQINTISVDSIRSSIGIFKEDFGLIIGTIGDNLKMTGASNQQIINVSEKIGLIEDLNKEVFDQDGNIILPQDTLFRLQMARIAIQNPKMILIETPLSFESNDTEASFFEFVEYMSKRKTVIIITDNPQIIVYSDKILFLDGDNSMFGTHAMLSKAPDYQGFIGKFKVNPET